MAGGDVPAATPAGNSDLPLRVRWRYQLRPAWLRVAINRAWPGRWSQAEIDQIMTRARKRAAEFEEMAD